MIDCLPLPVRKNKFGEKVKDIGVQKYYLQIVEEVWEAYSECVKGDTPREAEELADVITCCVTRLDVMHWYKDGVLFEEYIKRIVAKSMRFYEDSAYFYTDLTVAVMDGYHAAKTGDIISNCDNDILKYFSMQDVDEEAILGDIIVLCIERLKHVGYDKESRQQLYQSVNEKNRQRGYFD